MTSGVSAELLKQLSCAAEGLNNVSDIFNGEIKAIEEALASYNIGVSAWVSAYRDSWDECDRDGNTLGIVETDYSIGYQKSDGKWCLVVASKCEYGYPPGDPERREWLLLDAPRSIRMKAISAIPKLIEALIAEANRLTADITQKTTDARMLAVSIKPKAKGQ
jgi:hypothetical protein